MAKKNTANVFNIQRFSIHDGPGIRTVVFLKGCPMRCLWCANPESQRTEPDLIVNPQNCIGCGECLKVCPQKAISFTGNGICLDRKRCKTCGSCAGECYSRTLKFMGKSMTAEEVFLEIEKDALFYKNSGGGFTLSGGEPLLHGEFCIELTDMCVKNKYHGAIETSGYGDTEILVELAKKLDLVFFDLKHMDDETHKKLTGVSNAVILANLKAIQDHAKEIVIRTPVVPGCNDTAENIERTADFISALRNVTTWELLPYHRLGEHKYAQLSREYELSGIEKPDKDKMAEFVEISGEKLGKHGIVCKINMSSI